MRAIITLAFTLIGFLTLCQVKPFGDISMDELIMKSYDPDPATNAVVLFDTGDSKFIESPEGGYDIQFTRTRRVKIFKNDDESNTEVSIPYYQNGRGKTERIETLQAHTVNLKDGIPEYKNLAVTSVFDEKINSTWSAKKFIFPNVIDGSIIEYTYTMVTPFHFNLPDWRFQSRIPTMYSEYKVAMIPFYEYVFLVQGISEFDYKNSKVAETKRSWGNVSKVYGQNVGSGVEFQDYVHTYVLKDVPAFRDESYISSVDDYIIKLDFQLAKFHSPTGGTTEIITTWPQLIEDILKEEKFGKFIKGCSKYTKKIALTEFNIKDVSAAQKVKLITEYVKNNYRWNGYRGILTQKSPKAFFTQKEGSVAELNLFLIALLQDAGIDTKPVLLSTRGHGKVKNDYPFLHFFDYVVAYAKTDQAMLLDATDPYLSTDQIPSRCLNDKALIIDKEAVNFIDLRTAASSVNKKIFHFTNLNMDRSTVELELSIQTTSYESVALKRKFEDKPDRILAHFSNEITDYTEASSFNFNKPKRPYILNLKGETELEHIGDNIIIKPFESHVIAKNPFTQKKRNYPVDFTYPTQEQFSSTIEIPEGYQPSKLPEGISMSNGLADIELTYSLKENIVSVEGEYFFKKSVYGSREYARIKYYFKQIIESFNKEIVLEKI